MWGCVPSAPVHCWGSTEELEQGAKGQFLAPRGLLNEARARQALQDWGPQVSSAL